MLQRGTLGALLLGLGACGGPDTTLVRLRAQHAHTGPRLVVRNKSEVIVDGFYLAPTRRVQAAPDHGELGSEAEALTWGDNLLAGALLVGAEQSVQVPGAGRWDARAIDEHGRYQHIVGLRLDARTSYALELYDGTWRQFR